MKTVTALGVLQVTLLLLLLGQSQWSADEADRSAANTTVTAASGGSSETGTGARAYLLTEADLRRVVREELAARLATATMPDTKASASAPVADGREDREYRYQLAAATRELDLYRSVGVISESEMHDLQSSILELEEGDRSELMQQLVRALNSGAVKGRF